MTDDDATSTVWFGRHPSTQHFESLFEYGHLSAGKPRDTSMIVAEVAEGMVETLPDGPELSAGLRKLLEAKDCFVRAAILQARRGKPRES